jgi:hypothetical protein
MKKPQRSKTGRPSRIAHQRLVSRQQRTLVTFYIPPDGGTKFVMPGEPDEAGLDLASDHMGIPAVQIKTRRRWVTDAFLKELLEYDG